MTDTYGIHKAIQLRYLLASAFLQPSSFLPVQSRRLALILSAVFPPFSLQILPSFLFFLWNRNLSWQKSLKLFAFRKLVRIFAPPFQKMRQLFNEKQRSAYCLGSDST